MGVSDGLCSDYFIKVLVYIYNSGKDINHHAHKTTRQPIQISYTPSTNPSYFHPSNFAYHILKLEENKRLVKITKIKEKEIPTSLQQKIRINPGAS